MRVVREWMKFLSGCSRLNLGGNFSRGTHTASDGVRHLCVRPCVLLEARCTAALLFLLFSFPSYQSMRDPYPA